MFVGRRRHLVGETIDYACTPRLTQSASAVAGCYDAAIDAGAHDLLVDLSEVDFIDSTGLGVLIGATKRLQPRGGALAVVCPQEKICRVFQITGLDLVLAMHASRDEALSAAPQGDLALRPGRGVVGSNARYLLHSHLRMNGIPESAGTMWRVSWQLAA